MDDHIQLSTGFHKKENFIGFHKINKTTCYVKEIKSYTLFTTVEDIIYKGSDCDILKKYFEKSK